MNTVVKRFSPIGTDYANSSIVTLNRVLLSEGARHRKMTEQRAKICSQFISNPKLSLNEEETAAISQYISQCLKENITRENPCGILIGTGGSVVYLRKLHEFCNPSVPDGTTLAFTFKKSFIEDLTKTICSLNILERRKEFHFLPEDRLDIIPSALITILEVMNFMEIDELTHSFHNLRFGIAANPKLMD